MIYLGGKKNQILLLIVFLEHDGDRVSDDSLPVPDGILGDAGVTLAHPKGQVRQAAVTFP